MPALMDKLVKDAQGNVDFKLEAAEMAGMTSPTDTDGGVTSLVVNMKGLEGPQKLSLNTNALENKINAINVI